MAAQALPHNPHTLSVGLFILIALAGISIAFGFQAGPLFFLLGATALLLSFRYTYFCLYLGIALTPFLGIMVAIPTGALQFGQRAFGGSIDVSLGEVILFFAAFAWVLKIFFYWWRRNDRQWVPRLPILASYLALFFSHLVSFFSPLMPDPVFVAKNAMRPVLFDYIVFIALPVNLLRSRRRLVSALLVVACVGSIAAANGLLAMFFPSNPGQFIGRAHPMPMFGVGALGENHNELAEILVFTAFATLAVSLLVKRPGEKRLLVASSLFQILIGLLTFTRTAWIVFILQALFLAWTVWRGEIQKHLRTLCIVALLLLPMVVIMAAYSVSETASSSNSTRFMLSQIALQLFASSPWFGAGAGTFVERVGSTQVFLLEYGDALDSHGFLQKLAAETGILGLLAIAAVYLQLVLFWKRGAKEIVMSVTRQAFLLLVTGAGGALVYQLFNTDYWTGKMWLPVGLSLAAAYVLKEAPRDILEA